MTHSRGGRWEGSNKGEGKIEQECKLLEAGKEGGRVSAALACARCNAFP